MFWLDLVIVISLIIGVIKGLIDGIVKQVITFIALILAIFLSGTVVILVRNFADKYFEIEDTISPFILNAILYLFAFATILSLFVFLGNIINKAINYTPIGFVNRAFGAAFGGIFTILCLSILLNLLSVFDSSSLLITKQTQEKSAYYDNVKEIFPLVYPYIKEHYKN